MLTQEANLLKKAAELAHSLESLYHQVRKANIPEPAKSAAIHIAANNATYGKEVIADLVSRYLTNLSRNGPRHDHDEEERQG